MLPYTGENYAGDRANNDQEFFVAGKSAALRCCLRCYSLHRYVLLRASVFFNMNQVAVWNLPGKRLDCQLNRLENGNCNLVSRPGASHSTTQQLEGGVGDRRNEPTTSMGGLT